MKSKKIFLLGLLTLMLSMSFLLTGCLPPEQPTFKELTVGSYFYDDVNPSNEALTMPEDGRYTFLEGDSALIDIVDEYPYSFSYWSISTIKDGTIDTYTTESRRVRLRMDNNIRVIAFFGCDSNSACVDGYACIDNECVLSDMKELRVRSFFKENVVPTNADLTNPSSGIYFHEEGERVTLTIVDEYPYEFDYWTIHTILNGSIYSESDDGIRLRVEMDNDKLVEALFGCASDSACVDGYVCVDSECVYGGNVSDALVDQFIDIIEDHGHVVVAGHADNFGNFEIVTSDNFEAIHMNIFNHMNGTEELIDMIVSDYHADNYMNILFQDADSLSNTVSFITYLKQINNISSVYMNVAFWVTLDNRFVYFGTSGITDSFDSGDIPEIDTNLIFELEALTPGNPAFVIEFFDALHNYNFSSTSNTALLENEFPIFNLLAE